MTQTVFSFSPAALIGTSRDVTKRRQILNFRRNELGNGFKVIRGENLKLSTETHST